MKSKEIICIVCPNGCHLEIEKKGDEYVVRGNKCPRGKIYGVKELTNPTRVVTTTVKIKDGKLKMLPVKTRDPIPKNKISVCMRAVDKIEVKPPISVGDVLVQNIAGTHVDLIASRSV